MSIIQGRSNQLRQLRKLVNRPSQMMLGVVESVDTVTTVIPGTPGTSTSYIESRYWRIFITANNGAAFTTLKEVQIISPTNAVLTSTGTVTGESSSYPGDTAAKLVDGSLDDSTGSWATDSGQAVPSWVSFDIGTVQAVKAINLMPQTFDLPARAPKDFQIQTSPDGVTWTTVVTESEVTAWTAEAYRTVTLPTTGGSGGTEDTTITTTGAVAGVNIRGTVYVVGTGGLSLAIGDSVMVASGMVQRKLSGTLGSDTNNIVTFTGG